MTPDSGPQISNIWLHNKKKHQVYIICYILPLANRLTVLHFYDFRTHPSQNRTHNVYFGTCIQYVETENVYQTVFSGPYASGTSVLYIVGISRFMNDLQPTILIKSEY